MTLITLNSSHGENIPVDAHSGVIDWTEFDKWRGDCCCDTPDGRCWIRPMVAIDINEYREFFGYTPDQELHIDCLDVYAVTDKGEIIPPEHDHRNDGLFYKQNGRYPWDKE